MNGRVPGESGADTEAQASLAESLGGLQGVAEVRLRKGEGDLVTIEVDLESGGLLLLTQSHQQAPWVSSLFVEGQLTDTPDATASAEGSTTSALLRLVRSLIQLDTARALSEQSSFPASQK